MKSGKKAIIALSTVCAVVVIALVTVISVWAATSQTVVNTFNVTYSATNVNATVKADYLKGKTTGEWTSIGSTSFKTTDADDESRQLGSMGKIDLTATENYVIFRYQFHNDSTSNTLTVSLTDSTNKENVTVNFYSSDSDTVVEESFTETDFDSVTDKEVAPSEDLYVYVRVKITNDVNNAHYTGNLKWVLANKA